MAKEPVTKQNALQQNTGQQKIARQITVLEVLKSLVVIPVVVAIVMGVGWGLVRLATWELQRSGKPDPVSGAKAFHEPRQLATPLAAGNSKPGRQHG
jgi:hypothetical protein